MELRHKNSSLREIDVDNRTAEFIISDNTKDRHNTILDVDGWHLDNYNKNGIVGYQHDVYGEDQANPDSVIGIGKAEIRDGKLIGIVKFEPEEINPLAEKIFKKVQFGTLKATSVGFNPLEQGEFRKMEDSDSEIYHYGKRDLLEFSIVNIPSNPNAVRSIEKIESERLTLPEKIEKPNTLNLKRKQLDLLEKIL
jgi:HK97 family phage prohead protease